MTLKERWKDGPQTYMGLQVSRNSEPARQRGPSWKGRGRKSPRVSEPVILWFADLIEYMRDDNVFTRIEANPEAEKEWTNNLNESSSKTMASEIRSYSFGDNVVGKPHVYVAYAGTLPDFVNRLEEVPRMDIPVRSELTPTNQQSGCSTPVGFVVLTYRVSRLKGRTSPPLARTENGTFSFPTSSTEGYPQRRTRSLPGTKPTPTTSQSAPRAADECWRNCM